MPGSTYREIAWSSAEVREATLSVALSGSASKRWGEHFDGVLALLAQGNGRWGHIALEKKAITVAAVAEGSEDELRHLLESVVMQVNSELGLEPEPEAKRAVEDPQRAVDQRLTESFRSFAEQA